MVKFLSGILFLVLAFAFQNCGSSMPVFRSAILLEKPKPEQEGLAQYLDYTIISNYFGFVSLNQEPDTKINRNADGFYLYVWLPEPVLEMGIRVISPVGGLPSPSGKDFESLSFREASEEDLFMPSWFDTWVKAESTGIQSAENIPNDAKALKIQKNLGENDDHEEAYPLESRHAMFNSLLRIQPEQALLYWQNHTNLEEKNLLQPGLYRITISTIKSGRPFGSYLLSVGILPAPISKSKFPVISSNLMDLADLIQNPRSSFWPF